MKDPEYPAAFIYAAENKRNYRMLLAKALMAKARTPDEGGSMTKFTTTNPPISIFDFLQYLESIGVEIPEEIDEWWEEETYLMMLEEGDET